jgi:hypothetical protein
MNEEERQLIASGHKIEALRHYVSRTRSSFAEAVRELEAVLGRKLGQAEED